MNIVVALLFLSIIIMVHELGHFLTGKLVGIYAEEFSIGMGPRLLKYEGKETVYSLRAFPIGGYVKFLGEEDDYNDPRAFNNAPVWKRFIVIVSGALMNFIFAIVLLSLLFSIYGIAMPSPIVENIRDNSPAQVAGFEQGDQIVGIGDIEIEQEDTQEAIYKIQEFLQQYGDRQIDIKVLRQGSYKTLTVAPRYDQATDSYIMGVEFGYELHKFGFGKSLLISIPEIGRISTNMLQVLGNLVFKREGLDQVSGPVGIVGEIGKAAKAGVEHLMLLGIAISLNLGILNLIPFPALDGGRLLLLIIEGLRGKPMDREKEGLINLVGFALLLMLMIAVTFKDITG